MNDHKLRLALILLLALPIGVQSAEEEAESLAVWAEDIDLILFGGPPPGDLEVLINGEFAAEVTDAPPPTSEISDLLKPGVNTRITDFVVKGKNQMVLDFAPSCMVRPSGRDDEFRIAVATGELEVDVVQLGPPLALITHTRSRKLGVAFQRKASFRAR